jgi:DNA-binding transcriptional regulator GbsR (MarR family)
MTDAAERDRFVERMGGALTDAGLPRLPARVFAALLADDDGRMTAAELSSALGVSPAGVSGAVNYLSRVGMLRRERERGSRRDVYVVDDDAWHEAMMREDQAYRPMLAALDSAVESVGSADPAYRRLCVTREFLRFVSEEMRGIAGRWDERRRALERELGG